MATTDVFKIGDTIKFTYAKCCSAYSGKVYVVKADPKCSGSLGVGDNDNDLCHCTEHWVKITTSTNNSNMNLLQKAALAFKGEPEKSFIKAGIIDNNEIPTEDGVKLVVARMLKDKDFSTKFKAEVVDPILAEDANSAK